MDGFSVSTTNRDRNNYDILKFLDEEWVYVEKARRILRRAYLYGSPARARTSDNVVNSHALYQLSYRRIKSNYQMRDELYRKNISCQRGMIKVVLRKQQVQKQLHDEN